MEEYERNFNTGAWWKKSINQLIDQGDALLTDSSRISSFDSLQAYNDSVKVWVSRITMELNRIYKPHTLPQYYHSGFDEIDLMSNSWSEVKKHLEKFITNRLQLLTDLKSNTL